jgi:hypothetical protein
VYHFKIVVAASKVSIEKEVRSNHSIGSTPRGGFSSFANTALT